jgi:drug/metabolite transporter (DMT)-like permease
MKATSARWVGLVPYLFVLIWSSGYVVAKYGLPYAEALTFLSVRYGCVIVFMLVLAGLASAPWPDSPRRVLHIAVAGVLIQAGYLGGVWCAIKLGMPAGVAALIVNTQPILTAIAGRTVGERVRGWQWAGLFLGLAGVALVVSNKISLIGMSWPAVGLAVLALLSMTAGTLYQKRYCPSFDVRTGQVIQFSASLAVTLPLALAFETNHIDWDPHFFAALAWSVFILSGGGISLLFIMIRHGAATRVTSYLYLVPPVTALMAWLMFGETFSLLACAGMALTVAAVALVVRAPDMPAAALQQAQKLR